MSQDKLPTRVQRLRKPFRNDRSGTVPPRQYDVMSAPVLVAPTAPVARPGAEDHKRHTSRGYRC